MRALAGLPHADLAPLTGYGLPAFAVVEVLARSLDLTGGVSASYPIGQALRNNTFPTVLGEIDFNALGQMTRPSLALYRMRAGRLETEPPN